MSGRKLWVVEESTDSGKTWLPCLSTTTTREWGQRELTKVRERFRNSGLRYRLTCYVPRKCAPPRRRKRAIKPHVYVAHGSGL